VNGSVFTDIDGDGDPDLVLACEWGPVRVMENEGGQFKEITDAMGLGKYRGWWNGLATGDFDEDGRMDLVASNWGRNTPYQMYFTSSGHPIRLYYGDWDGNGAWDLAESYYHDELKKWVPIRDLDFMAQGFPLLQGQFNSYRTYGQSSVDEIFGAFWSGAKYLEADWLETTVFLNREGGFVAEPLPGMAQLAPAFGVAVGDADGDGHDDVFLAQNFFASLPGVPRYDGGRGLWLLGDGKGGFRAISGRESGVKIYGEQRGCALADFDEDGRVDLLVGQNGGETKLYWNRRGRAGLRVQVEGTSGNPLGLGVKMCLVDAKGRKGPIREIQSGSGFWSQNGAIQVLGWPESRPPQQLWIQWPGQRAFEKWNLRDSQTSILIRAGQRTE